MMLNHRQLKESKYKIIAKQVFDACVNGSAIDCNDALNTLHSADKINTMTNSDGQSILHTACMHKNIDMVQNLLDRGADPKKMCNGLSPLQLALKDSKDYASITLIDLFAKQGITTKIDNADFTPPTSYNTTLEDVLRVNKYVSIMPDDTLLCLLPLASASYTNTSQGIVMDNTCVATKELQHALSDDGIKRELQDLKQACEYELSTLPLRSSLSDAALTETQVVIDKCKKIINEINCVFSSEIYNTLTALPKKGYLRQLPTFRSSLESIYSLPIALSQLLQDDYNNIHVMRLSPKPTTIIPQNSHEDATISGQDQYTRFEKPTVSFSREVDGNPGSAFRESMCNVMLKHDYYTPFSTEAKVIERARSILHDIDTPVNKLSIQHSLDEGIIELEALDNYYKEVMHPNYDLLQLFGLTANTPNDASSQVSSLIKEYKILYQRIKDESFNTQALKSTHAYIYENAFNYQYYRASFITAYTELIDGADKNTLNKWLDLYGDYVDFSDLVSISNSLHSTEEWSTLTLRNASTSYSPFTHGISYVDNPVQYKNLAQSNAMEFSIVAQFFVGVVGIFSHTNGLSDKDFGVVFDSMDCSELSTRLATALKENQSIEYVFFDFIHQHTSDFGLTRSFTQEEIEFMIHEFKEHYKKIAHGNEKDEFILHTLPYSRGNNFSKTLWKKYANNVCCPINAMSKYFDTISEKERSLDASKTQDYLNYNFSSSIEIDHAKSLTWVHNINNKDLLDIESLLDQTGFLSDRLIQLYSLLTHYNTLGDVDDSNGAWLKYMASNTNILSIIDHIVFCRHINFSITLEKDIREKGISLSNPLLSGILLLRALNDPQIDTIRRLISMGAVIDQPIHKTEQDSFLLRAVLCTGSKFNDIVNCISNTHLDYTLPSNIELLRRCCANQTKEVLKKLLALSKYPLDTASLSHIKKCIDSDLFGSMLDEALNDSQAQSDNTMRFKR